MTPGGPSSVPGPPSPRPPAKKWLVAVSIGLGAIMGSIDVSIVNVALPQIRGAVGATIQEITWISTGYAIALVVVMPLTGFLGRLFGQKRLYLAFLLLFVAGSALCGLARSLETLVAFRLVQGIGGGALQPTQQAILRQTFPPKEQGMAMALFGMVAMLGPAIGPTLGGYIVDNWHWSWIFFINLPIGLAAAAMVGSFVHEDAEIVAANHALAHAQRKWVDWIGIGLMAAGLAALQYFLEEGQRDDWFESRVITLAFLIAVVCLAAFVVRELTARVPAVDLRLFADAAFTSGTLIGALMGALLLGTMFLLPIFMQELLGFTAVQSGLALVPRTIAMLLVMPIVGRLYNHISPRLVVGVGVCLVVLASYQMSALTLQSGARDILVPNLLQGGGFACLFVPLTTVALSGIPRHRLQDASGLNSLLRQLGGAIGLSVFATLLDHHAVEARASISTHLNVGSPLLLWRLDMLRAGLATRGVGPASASAAAFTALYRGMARQALVIAFEHVLLVSGLVFLLALPLLAFLKSKHAFHREVAPPPTTEGPTEPNGFPDDEVPAFE